MKRWTLALVGLALVAGLVFCTSAGTGLAQQGGQGFPNNPFAPPSQPGNPFLPGGSGAAGNSPAASSNSAPRDGPPPNADIAIKSADGEWVICLIVYRGPEAHQMARQFVSVLRGKDYGLWAYIYDYTPELRKQQEMLRQEQIEKYRAAFKMMGQAPPPTLKIRVQKINVEDEVAVLVGGFKDQASARKMQNEMRDPQRYKMPDPSKVQMDKYFSGALEAKIKVQDEYISPFSRAFVARNPALPKVNNQPEWDMNVLRSLNQDESFSLLKCPKKITLMVREYRLPVYIQPAGMSSSAQKNNLSGSMTAEKDAALQNAHGLAGKIRTQAKLDAYVLHDRTASYVTIGGFDSMEDPRLRETQQKIATLAQALAKDAQQNPLIKQNPQFDPLQIMPVGVPMLVPR